MIRSRGRIITKHERIRRCWDGGDNAIYGNGGNDTIYIRNGTYDCADGGGQVGDTCYADRTPEFEDSVSGFENVFYG